MKINKIIKELKDKYPGKRVIVTDPENPTEVICEIEETEKHPTWSKAIAVVDSIRPHYHKELKEKYTVIKGKLKHYMDYKVTNLSEGQSVEIPPGSVHWAEGNETWFEVYSEPGWTPDEHILVTDDGLVNRKIHDKKFK